LGKAGLLSAAAHEHWVNAPIVAGADQELLGVHGVTLTRLLYERCAAFGKVACYF
jgi:hypothetical protein